MGENPLGDSGGGGGGDGIDTNIKSWKGLAKLSIGGGWIVGKGSVCSHRHTRCLSSLVNLGFLDERS